jgi:hypothetical protein
MDGIQTWSSFEERQRYSGVSVSGNEISSSVSRSNVGTWIDALYVSTSSPDIAPVAAALLRNSGLSAVPSTNIEHLEYGGDINAESQRKFNDEFRLKFHWMRPHPSLVFSVEDDLLATGTDTADQPTLHAETPTRKKKQHNKKANPAVESSRLMEAYRSSQMNKSALATDSDCDGTAGAPNESLAAPNIQPDLGNLPHTHHQHHLPMECPKLRINLAALVEPPLMTSWLPGGDIDNSTYNDREDDYNHETNSN